MSNTQPEYKDLAYYKNNAEEDYKSVPISVLRYISELEKIVQYTSVEDKTLTAEELNYIEDFRLEDGRNENVCDNCKRIFLGLRQRSYCKFCQRGLENINIEVEDKILSAEEYLVKNGLSGFTFDSMLALLEGFAQLRVEQARVEWEKEKEDLMNTIRISLPEVCVEGWGKPSYCNSIIKCKKCF